MNNIQSEFKKIIDSYITNYASYEKGNTTFECEYGELIFNKEYSNVITIFGILIASDHRQKGTTTYILQYLIDKCSEMKKCKYLCVQSVLSKILYEYLLRFKYKNKCFILNKLDGNFYFTI